MNLNSIKESLFGIPATLTLRGLKANGGEFEGAVTPWLNLSGRGQRIWRPYDEDGRPIQVAGRRVQLCVDDDDLTFNYIPGLAQRARARAIRRELKNGTLRLTVRNESVLPNLSTKYAMGFSILVFVVFFVVFPIVLLLAAMSRPVWWEFSFVEQLAAMLVTLLLPCGFWCVLAWASTHLMNRVKATQPRLATLTSQGVEGMTGRDQRFGFQWSEVMDIDPGVIIRLRDGRRYLFEPPSPAIPALREFRGVLFPEQIARESMQLAGIPRRS